MPLTHFTPPTFSFFDGVDTITDANATFTSFNFATDSTGIVEVRDGATYDPPGVVGQSIYTINVPSAAIFQEEAGYVSAIGFGDARGNSPGKWTVIVRLSLAGSLVLLCVFGQPRFSLSLDLTSRPGRPISRDNFLPDTTAICLGQADIIRVAIC